MSAVRYVVGIDLGTTNSALAFSDSFDGYADVKTLRVPQLKAPGEIVESELLPSFAYTPDAA
jgi:molecular chaperone DnaK (HSP70)